MIETIAGNLMTKNPKLVEALESAPAKGQYKAIEPYITGQLLAKIGKAQSCYVKKQDLIWAIINVHNGDGAEELDY